MPVCLTGDVHHASLGTSDQSALDRPEPDTAVEFADYVESYGLEVTLFLTGQTAVEAPDCVRELASFDCVEIGGHNFGAFTVPWIPRSEILFKGYRHLTGNNCPGWVQRRGIRKTRHRIEDLTGNPVVSWRDHAFNRDDNTYELLAEAGIRYVSDERAPDRQAPYAVKTSGGSLLEVPINVPPDHDHIDHGTLNHPTGWSDPFSDDIYSTDEWFDRVLDRVARIDAEGGVAIILAHPACMALADDFRTFERLCEALADFETSAMKDIKQIS